MKDIDVEICPSHFTICKILASRIRQDIEDRGWGQKEAAKHLKTTQARISHINNMRVEELAEKSLLQMLELLGHSIDPKLVVENGTEFIQVNIYKK